MAAVAPRLRSRVDHALLYLTLALVVIGVVMVFDAGYARAVDAGSLRHDVFYFLKKQAQFAVLGLVGMFLAMRADYTRLRTCAPVFMALAIVLLLAVWLPVIGIRDNGSARWIGFGALRLQPSELAKLAIIIYLAAILSNRNYPIRSFGNGVLAPLLVIGLTAVLIEREPDLGTATVTFLAGLSMLALAGARAKHLGAVLAVVLLYAAVSTLFHSYRMDRLRVWLSPEKHYTTGGYQLARGLVAVGSGGISGLGLGAGREKFYLPAANTDFVFATVAEETGLIGAVTVLMLLGLLVWRACHIARHARDPFGAYLAAGVAVLIAWQSIINVAVVTNSIPATGVPLPFVSYGGSSLVVLMVSIGILLSVAQSAELPQRARFRVRDRGKTSR